MSITRFSALDILNNRSNLDLNVPEMPTQNIASFFGENVFNEKAMKEYMPEKEFLNLMATIQGGTKLTKDVAEVVADAMKRWAMDRGVTHYAHWFQPWTGKSAEKHDSFFNLTPDGKIVEEFGAGSLLQHRGVRPF